MATVMSMVVRFFAQTQEFDSAVRRSSQNFKSSTNSIKASASEMKNFTSLAFKGTAFGVASFAAAKSLNMVTNAIQQFNSSEKQWRDYVNVIAESIPMFGMAAKAARNLAEELNGVSENKALDKIKLTFSETSGNLLDNLKNQLSLAKAPNETARQLEEIRQNFEKTKKEITKTWNIQMPLEEFNNKLTEQIAAQQKNIDYMENVRKDAVQTQKAGGLWFADSQLALMDKKINTARQKLGGLMEQRIQISPMIDHMNTAKALRDQLIKNVETAANQKAYTEEIEKSTKAFNNLKQELDSLFNDTRTPLEEATMKWARLNELFYLGFINAELYGRGVKKIKDELARNTEDPLKDIKEFSAGLTEDIKTPIEKFADAMTKVGAALRLGVENGGISAKQANLAKEFYKNKFLEMPEMPTGDTRSIDERFMSIRGLAMGGGNTLAEEQLAESKKQTEYQRQIAGKETLN
jgi:hypothetical protein